MGGDDEAGIGRDGTDGIESLVNAGEGFAGPVSTDLAEQTSALASSYRHVLTKS